MRREAAALWLEMFGEPPAIEADGELMLAIIIAHLEDKDYMRLASADRARGLTWPRYERQGAGHGRRSRPGTAPEV